MRIRFAASPVLATLIVIICCCLPSTPGALARAASHLRAVDEPRLPPGTTGVDGYISLNHQEQEFVALVNRERTSRGLAELSIDPVLVNAARGHSEEMAERNYFDHHSPTEGLATPMDRYLSSLHEAGADQPAYVLVGENIFYCSVFDKGHGVNFGHTALMNSPGHRANILEPRFRKIGVGTYRDSNGRWWVTEMFLRDTDPDPDSGE